MSVRIEKQGPVTTVIVDRPEVRNAVDRATAAALAEGFEAFDKDDEAMVGVLWGANGTFCSGADLKAIAGGRGNRVAPDGQGPMGPTRMLLGKPVIAAISGFAVAGGLELALWCDLRVMEEDAVLGVFCRRWGVPLIDGGTVRLPRLIGLSRALDLILTGRPVDADEALRIGLANRVVAKGTARQEAELLALQIAAFPQVCMREDRLSAYQQFGLDLTQAISNEFNHGLRSLEAGAIEGARRFTDQKKEIETRKQVLESIAMTPISSTPISSSDDERISWFPVPSEEELPDNLQGLFRKAKEKIGFVPNVFRVYSFRPERLTAWFSHYKQLHVPTDNLNAAEREMIAVAVSMANGCLYCLVAHGAALREALGDPIKADRITIDYKRAGLDARMEAVLDFAVKLTISPHECLEEDIEHLKASGLTEQEVWDVMEIAAMYNFTNRMASATGMLPNREYHSLCR